jgi:hypothetical protein
VIAVIGVGALAGGVGAAAGSIVEQGVDHGHVDPGKVVTDTVGGTIGGAVGAPVGHVLGKTLGNGTINIGGGMSVATVGGPSLPVGAITVSAGTVGGAVSVGSVVITSRSGAHLTNVFMAAKRMADEEAKEVDAPSSSLSGPVSFGDNFTKKVRKHIDQVRNRGAVKDPIPSPGNGGVEAVERVIRDRVAQGGGRATTYAGEPAIAFQDGGVTYIFRATGEFWTILGN